MLSSIAVLVVALGADHAQDSATLAHGAVAGERFRVIVSTDIGGSDPDDFQSMVHLMVYADALNVEGLISSPPQAGRAAHIHEVIDAYEADYPRLAEASEDYPAPDRLRALVKQGATDPAPEAGFSDATEGSRWIVERGRATDARPLYILVWGSITDVAQAVHDAPDIKTALRVYSISSWNTAQDRAARNYLYEQHPDLWWIESDTTFRGMYVGGNQSGDVGNKSFLDAHVRDHGALGNLLVDKLSAIKMGDTPSVLYLLAGDPADPTGPHWGGSYVATEHGPHYWTDNPSPDLVEGKYNGAKTVNRWREAFLRDWQRRMEGLKKCASPADLPSQLPPVAAGQEWRMVWHDEFDGTSLDEGKWERMNCPRRDAYWSKDDAYLDGNGCLVLRTQKDGDRFTSGAVRTKGKCEHRYGYWECRCQFPGQQGHWPAFWMMSVTGLPTANMAGRPVPKSTSRTFRIVFLGDSITQTGGITWPMWIAGWFQRE